jgi:serine protease AprX
LRGRDAKPEVSPQREMAQLPATDTDVTRPEVALTITLPSPSIRRVRWRPRTVALAAAVGLAGALPHAAAAATPLDNVTPALQRIAGADAGRHVEVIVQFASAQDAARGPAAVRAAGGAPGRELELIDGRQARLPAGGAVRLAARPGVRAVTLNAAVQKSDGLKIDAKKLRTAYNQSVRADRAWHDDDVQAGAGVGVAVVDTGIAGDLVDFRVSERDASSRVVANVVVHPDATNPYDGVGHGTHVAGLIAGNGTARTKGDVLDNRYVGVAPQADLVNVKVSDDQGRSTVADVINGLQFVVDRRRDYNIRVANLSLTSTVAQSYRIDPLAAAAEQAHFAGILVVAASGNNGPDSVRFAPGNDPYVLSVGGADDRGTKDTRDDVVASWTSTGTTQDGFRKPEVMAPGARLVSTLTPGSAYAGQCPTCIVDGQYLRLGGTSMAAGVVSGAAAILAQVHPDWTPSQIKGALIHTSRDVPGTGTEISVDDALDADEDDPAANVGLTPNTLIDAATGTVDPARARWSGFEWHTATDSLRARWSSASFVCSCAKIAELAADDPLRSQWGGADPARARWSGIDNARARWSDVGWMTSFAR